MKALILRFKDDSVYKKIKAKSVMDERSLNSTILMAIKQYLGENK